MWMEQVEEKQVVLPDLLESLRNGATKSNAKLVYGMQRLGR
jgi:hypothetical protein